ncbi:protein-glutamate O-methyltransferase CheR [Pseudomonas sp. S75]|uniref:CheR family methyltransferase n=1 Tax=unclassified Pseudomonas TaxID=196821 RepID=UPI0019085D65|nr:MULTISPECIES: protein-glutamate O-methyltransferase CheR [unclassified Pseudomonas]MBJ9978230.1 protein-glutamate O-methyltransferase CheR [Pseudomonas sp. S30]MBK0156112.1 protein-glutamate O-methyltransferase CheR [Pseudomonas sp. S75]
MTDASSPPHLDQAGFERIRQRVHQATGHRLADTRLGVVAGRLHSRLQHHGLSSFEAYLELVDAQPGEQALLLSLLIARDTYFFREHRHFEHLLRWLAGIGHRPRLWSAACATGEEAWSLAMVADQGAPGGWEVLASDYDDCLLQQARTGLYDVNQARYFPPGWVSRYCLCGAEQTAGRLRIAAGLREGVRFENINLIRPLPEHLGAFDAILLRNLLAGFDERCKADVLLRLMPHLRPGGLLMIGHSESIHRLDLPLRPILPSVFERL